MQHIPFAILNNLMLLGILWLVYQLLANYTKWNAHTLFIIATGFQFSATALFLLDIFDLISFNQSLTFQSNLVSFSSFLYLPTENILWYAGVVYTIALLILVVNMLVQFTKLNGIRLNSDFSDSDNWKQLVVDFQLGAKNNYKIGISEHVQSPIVFGFLEPIILLPVAICNQLSTEELKMILLHELAHIVRNDYIVNIIIGCSKLILWFNPFAYLMNNAIELQREIACDNLVMKYYHAPLSYSKTLFQLATVAHNNKINFSLGVLNAKHDLLYRIQKLNNVQTSNWTIVQFSKICLFVCLTSIAFIKLNFTSNIPSVINSNQHFAHPKSAANSKFVTAKIVTVKVNNKRLQKLTRMRFTEPVVKKEAAANGNTWVTILPTKTQDSLNYNSLLTQTKQWIKAHENPVQFATYIEAKDSIENIVAERLLMGSIIKNYQLKKALLAQRLGQAKDENEASDYLLNSKEWAELVQYEQWAHEYLQRHQ